MMLPIRTRITGALALCALISAPAAEGRAASVTSAAELRSPAAVLDFGNFNFDPPRYETAFQEVGDPGDPLVGSVTWEWAIPVGGTGTGVLGNGTILGASYQPFDLGANGAWTGGRVGFAGLLAPAGSMTFWFATPVSGVGGLLNYKPTADGTGPVIEILRADGSTLELAMLADLAPISTGGSPNLGGFRGFQRDSAEIFGFRLSHQFVVLDDLTFTRSVPDSTPGTTVPEPSTAVLAAFGLVSIAGVRRLRRPS